MNYKENIVKMLEKINNPQVLRYINIIVKDIYDDVEENKD